MSKRVAFFSKSGQKNEGELGEPTGDGKAPAIVLLQEYWGVNDHIRSLVDRLAAEGFLVFAPDLYHGTVVKKADEAAALMGKLDWPKAFDEIAGAVDFVSTHARSTGKVGVTGFCLGGALTFATTTRVSGLAAAVVFYGIPDPSSTDYTKTRAPVLAHFASKDTWAKPEAAEKIKALLAQHGTPMELCVYEADHAFMNDTRPEVYNPDAAKLAWQRTVAFFKKNLG